MQEDMQDLFTSEEEKKAQRMRTPQELAAELDDIDKGSSASMRFLQPGSNEVDLTMATDMQERIFEFGDEENPRRVRRIIVNFADNSAPLCLPISVARKLKPFLQRGYRKLEIIRTGSGINTDYSVVPFSEEK